MWALGSKSPHSSNPFTGLASSISRRKILASLRSRLSGGCTLSHLHSRMSPLQSVCSPEEQNPAMVNCNRAPPGVARGMLCTPQEAVRQLGLLMVGGNEFPSPLWASLKECPS